jgi:hypothetical protein
MITLSKLRPLNTASHRWDETHAGPDQLDRACDRRVAAAEKRLKHSMRILFRGFLPSAATPAKTELLAHKMKKAPENRGLE